ncbi:CPBP family intramembrane glutamic endopeptidase [Microbacterium sp. P01]|uniref:CPBP family intramembrane glutamic endopeptidase n=1 Tax=unclassified Microbacterium TaxID=2609290 RepID=UPI00366E55A3
MRVTPRPWMAFVIWFGYCVVIVTVTLLSGIPFPEVGTTADATWRGAVMDLAVAAALLVIVTSLLGWWRPALFEQKRAQRTWPVFVPIVMAIAAVLNLANTDWSQFDTSFLLSLIALGVLVGFSEEMMARGLVLTSLRSRLSEGWVWFISSALFGLMHLSNVILGAPVSASVLQAVLAFASGTAFYILRRVTGSLVWAMVLHGLWDVSVFAVGHAPIGIPLGAVLGPVVGVLALATVFWVIKGTDEKPAVRVAAR